MTPEDYHSLALEIEDALFSADLKPNELRMARLIVKLSLRFERTSTPQLLQKDFGLLAGIRETHVAETLGWLLGKKVIELEAPDIYRPNPYPETWLVSDRVTAAAKHREAELLRDKTAPQLWSHQEIRSNDPRVAFSDAEIAIAAENFRNPEVVSSEIRKCDSVHTSEIRKLPRDAHVHASATCHVFPSASQKHVHDHVHAPNGGQEENGATAPEITPDQQRDLLDQIDELTGPEGRTEHFRTTWLMRIRERPLAVFQAIGETRMAQREGRITRSIGGALNWHFKNFREAARKGAAKLRMLFFCA